MNGVPGLRASWTPRDEAQLKELVARKERVMAEFREKLSDVLLKIDGFKFLKPVLPGDVMTISVTKKSAGGPLISFDAVVTVDGQTRAKGSLAFTAMPRAAIEGNGENA